MAKQGALSALGKGGMSELWARLRFLFLAIIVYRIGAHIPVPGINPDRLADLFRQNEGTILSLFFYKKPRNPWNVPKLQTARVGLITGP